MSRQRAKGTRFETAVAAWLTAEGFPAERVAMHGSADQGDLRVDCGAFDLTAECKDRRRHDWLRALDEAEAESANAGTSAGFAVLHRDGVGAKRMGETPVLMTLSTLADLLRWCSR